MSASWQAFRKGSAALAAERSTAVSIEGEAFHINGKPTYAGRTWNGRRIEGLLLNVRLVQGIFDDLNPETVGRWAYPDTGRWDPDRNTHEFLAAMPEWRRHGLLCFTINLQGGSPQGYSKEQPWHNSAITPEGTLRPAYMARLEKILDRADELGMVAILGLFYFGQDARVSDEAAVIRATDAAVDWIYDHGYQNVLIEVNNECNVRYHHAILRPDRIDELIDRVKSRPPHAPSGSPRPRLLVSTSYGGSKVPQENVVRAADFLLMHGNGVKQPERIAEMVRQCRQVPGYRPVPILFNEDDHFDFDQPQNNMLSAISAYASWGYFDPGKSDYADGYQCPPVNWQINTPRKKAFFGLLREITGSGLAKCAAEEPWEELPNGVLGQVAAFEGVGGVKIAGYVRKPAGPGPFPLVIVLHGGAASARPVSAETEEARAKLLAAQTLRASQSLGRASNPPIPDFLAQGWAVYTIDYRANPRYKIDPLEIDDTLAAVTKAQSFSFVDPKRMAMFGGSHGGHITGRMLSRVNLACAVLCAPAGLDLIALSHLAEKGTPIGGNQGLIKELEQRSGTTMAEIEKKPDAYHYSSLLTEAANVRCPILLISGRNDPNAPLPVMELYADKLRAAGKETETYHPDNGPHGFYVAVPRAIPETAESTRRAVAFIKKHFEQLSD